MADVYFDSRMVPRRYDERLVVRLSKQMRRDIAEACRKRVVYQSTWLREAVEEKLKREGFA